MFKCAATVGGYHLDKLFSGIALDTMILFNRLKALSGDHAEILKALQKSSSGLLEVCNCLQFLLILNLWDACVKTRCNEGYGGDTIWKGLKLTEKRSKVLNVSLKTTPLPILTDTEYQKHVRVSLYL